MAGDIPCVPLGSLVDPDRGISYGIVQPGQHVDNGVPIVRVTDIRNGRISTSSPLCVAPEIASKYGRTTLRGGELLLTLVGTIGEAAIVPEELAGWNTARAVGVIPVKPDPGALWVKYALRTSAVQERMRARLNTTVQATLNLGEVSGLPIPILSPPARAGILSMLGSLDDKIELNRRTSETLESMARALFKSWFIDFDPVRAKAEGRIPAGMDADTAQLFPSEFEDTELGPIPKGWSWVTLDKLATLNPTYSLSGNKSAPYVEMANLSTTSHRPREWPTRTVGSGVKFMNGDTLLARITPCLENGKAGLVDFLETDEVGWGSTEYIVIRPLDYIPPAWAYLLTRDPAFRQFAILRMEGSSGRQRVSAAAISQYPLVAPPAPVFEKFGDQANGFFSDIAARYDQNHTLAQLRDTLLPRLLSGALPIRDAEQFLP